MVAGSNPAAPRSAAGGIYVARRLNSLKSLCMARERISIIIPCFNEEQVLPELFERLNTLEKKLKKKWDVEFVFVDDGSTDDTPKLLDNFIKDHEGRVVHFTRNFGHQAALEAGYLYARGDIFVTIDADLQDPPELILDMLKKYKEGYDVVLAKRRRRRGETFFKKSTARLFYKFLNFIANIPMIEEVGDFRLISKRVRDELLKLKEPHKYWRGLVFFLGFPTATVLYTRKPRAAGETHYSLKKMLNLARIAVFGFSDKVPLLVAGLFLLVKIFTIDSPTKWVFVIHAIFDVFVVWLILSLLFSIYRLLLGRPNYVVLRVVEGKQGELVVYSKS